jgi:hypothetical protein
MKEVYQNTADPVERKGKTGGVDWDDRADVFEGGLGCVVVDDNVVENGDGDV